MAICMNDCRWPHVLRWVLRWRLPVTVLPEYFQATLAAGAGEDNLGRVRNTQYLSMLMQSFPRAACMAQT